MNGQTLMGQYLQMLGDPHDKQFEFSVNSLDFAIRKRMGKIKSEKSNKPIACHWRIRKNQMTTPKGEENYCRVCGKDLSVVCGRYNDYLVIRNSNCRSPICLDCSQNNPDNFHINFKKAIKGLTISNSIIYRE